MAKFPPISHEKVQVVMTIENGQVRYPQSSR